MYFTTLIYTLAVMSSAGLAQYTLEDDYFASGDFYSMFSFWDTSDPTHGFVDYLSQSAAQAANLTQQTGGNAQWGVDYTNDAPNGRASVRLTSNKSYNSGLVVLDVDHMPGGICGTWPAFWMVGPNWPYDGEIDIMEGVNDQSSNDMTLHTGPSCSISNNGDFTGTLSQYTDCDSSEGSNNGCQIQAEDSNTYGTGFNDNGGGIYATEITSESINMWFFTQGSAPSDILSDSPNPSNWGEPLAKFSGSCDISSTFQQLQIVFDTTFCGDWAGNAWASSTCSQQADTCDDFVANNPSAFENAYWSVNALKVYSSDGTSDSNANAAAASSTTTEAAATSSATSVAPTTTFATSTSAPFVTGSGPIGEGELSPSSSAAAAPSTTSSGDAPFVTGSGPVGENNADPDGAAASSSSTTSSSAASVTGSGPIGSNEVTPSATSTSSSSAAAATGSGPLSSGDLSPSPSSGSDSGSKPQNAADPSSSSSSSPSSSSSSGTNYAAVSGTNGIISEELEPSRRARRARHLRAHQLRHARF